MARKPSGIRYTPGKRDLLVVSPHSPVINGVFAADRKLFDSLIISGVVVIALFFF